MRNIILLSLATFAFIATSCSKEESKKDYDKAFDKKCDKECEKECTKDETTVAYYSEDYKVQTTTIMGWDVADIDHLWYEFYSKESDYDYFALVAKSADGEINKTYGPCEIEWGVSMSFMPENGDAYTGEFSVGKEVFQINFGQEDRDELVTFTFKDC